MELPVLAYSVNKNLALSSLIPGKHMLESFPGISKEMGRLVAG